MKAFLVVLTLTAGAAVAADRPMPSDAVIKSAMEAIKAAPVVSGAKVTAHALPHVGVPPYIGFQVTSVTTSYAISGLPTFLAAGTGFDYDVALPLASMNQGDAAAVSITWVSDTYTGYCLGGYAIVPAAGGAAVAAGISSAQACNPGYIYAIGFPVTLPAVSGDFVVVGIAKSTIGTPKLINFLHIN